MTLDLVKGSLFLLIRVVCKGLLHFLFFRVQNVYVLFVVALWD